MGFFSSYVYDIVNVHIHGFKMHCLCLIFQEIGSWKFFIFYIYLVMEPLFNIINLNMKKGIHMFSLTHFLIKWVYIYCLMNLCLKKIYIWLSIGSIPYVLKTNYYILCQKLKTLIHMGSNN